MTPDAPAPSIQPCNAVRASEALVATFMAAFEQCLDGHETTHHLALDGAPIRVRSTSARLDARVLPSVGGLFAAPPSDRSPALRLHLWSGREAAPQGGALFAELARHADKVSVVNDGALHLQYNPQGEILSLIDCARGLAFYHVADPDALPDYEVCTPFRMLLNWFCDSIGLHFAHAAAVGVHDAGVLLVGHSGAGKSTTALSGLLHGLQFVGDDYVALADAGRDGIRVHALYRGCKLTTEALQRLPQLAPWQVQAVRTGDKNVVILDESCGALAGSLRVQAIVRPVVADAAHTHFEAVTPLSLLGEFAGSTVMQMPGTGQPMLRALTAICRKLPAYRMHMSRDPAEVAASLRRFVETPGGPA